MTVFEKVQCPRCGALRNPNLSIPCDLCKARNIPFLGYQYGLELSFIWKILAVLFFIVLCAFIVGAIAVFVWVVGLQSASLDLAEIYKIIFL